MPEIEGYLADNAPVQHYSVEFETNLDGTETHSEEVFARNELTAVARAAWITALKGYSILEVRSWSVRSGCL